MFKTAIIFLLLSTQVLCAKNFTREQLVSAIKSNDYYSNINESRIRKINSEIGSLESFNKPEVLIIGGGEYRDSLSDNSVQDSKLVAELRVNYQITDFGSKSKKVGALKEVREQQEHVKALVYFDLSNQISRLFYNGVYLQESLKEIKDELQANKKLMSKVRLRRRQGLVTESDSFELRVRESELRNQKHSIEVSNIHLQRKINTLLAQNEDTSIIFVDNTGLKYGAKFIQMGEEKLIQQAKVTNHDYHKAQSRIRSSELNLAAAKAGSRPTLSLTGRYGRMRIDETYTSNSNDTEGLVGLYLKIPLYDGGKTRSESSRLGAELEMEGLMVKRTVYNIKNSIRSNLSILIKTKENIKVLKKKLSLNNEYYESVLSDYSRGLKNSLDLVATRDKLLKNKIDYLEEIKTYHFVVLELEELIGKKI